MEKEVGVIITNKKKDIKLSNGRTRTVTPFGETRRYGKYIAKEFNPFRRQSDTYTYECQFSDKWDAGSDYIFSGGQYILVKEDVRDRLLMLLKRPSKSASSNTINKGKVKVEKILKSVDRVK